MRHETAENDCKDSPEADNMNTHIKQFSAHQQIHSTIYACIFTTRLSLSEPNTMDIRILPGWHNNIILEGRRYHQDMESAGVYVSSCTTWIIMFRLPKLSILVLIYNLLA